MKKIVYVLCLAMMGVPVFAQQRSVKRGLCWDENRFGMTDGIVDKLSAGISWFHTWGVASSSPTSQIGQGAGNMAFVPMCGNGTASFDEAGMRKYLDAHKGEVKYLLGCNQPMPEWGVDRVATPQEAADMWPKVKQIAEDYGLEIVAPALNSDCAKVAGYNGPFAWYDEFFRLCPNSGIDYLAFHCYYNYASSVKALVNEFFYASDNYGIALMGEENKAKYPHLVGFLEEYKQRNGHYPRMFLTEFCARDGYAWPGWDGTREEFQTDQMTMSVLALEKSDLVAAYAWYVGNAAGGVEEYPRSSVLQHAYATSELSMLGKVYVHMSSFDTSKYYTPGERVLAKDYIDAQIDVYASDPFPFRVEVRPNTDEGSDSPLQVTMRDGSWATYQVEVPETGIYTITLRLKTKGGSCVLLLGDSSKEISTDDQWVVETVEVPLEAGRQSLKIENQEIGEADWFAHYITVSEFEIQPNPVATTIETIEAKGEPEAVPAYDIQGRRINNLYRGIRIKKGRKIAL